ncbi:hypothetical protein DFJ58DRAFT_836036 [Suillus subalutaceus]|uniref:uncharacterized protein n=1 Tax=Suillus subalutaceus TaxID=48586 RepID=UPI001B881EA5|nr:uncharacterized protein DFJ58DRAFT_836036 [Suillus subalutaceus]KAG1875398.1 hypothetical protein DFJ58DRAFT_836036 [Suillus subalutaceus]
MDPMWIGILVDVGGPGLNAKIQMGPVGMPRIGTREHKVPDFLGDEIEFLVDLGIEREKVGAKLGIYIGNNYFGHITGGISQGQWMSDFIPIDQWTPPRVTHKFKDLKFRRYNIGLEHRIEMLESHLGNSDPNAYDRAYAGIDEYIKELAAMCSQDWIWDQHPASTESLMTECLHEEEEIGELMDEDTPLYDLGWTQDEMSALGESLISDKLIQRDGAINEHDDGPVYNLRWGPTPLNQVDKDGAPLCNLGWGGETLGGELEHPGIKVLLDGDDSPGYNLGWGSASASSGDAPMEQDDTISKDGDGPGYDLGWRNQSGRDVTFTYSRNFPPMQLDVIDLTDEWADARAEKDIIDLTNEDEPVYDLGWGVQGNEEGNAPRHPLPDKWTWTRTWIMARHWKWVISTIKPNSRGSIPIAGLNQLAMMYLSLENEDGMQ